MTEPEEFPAITYVCANTGKEVVTGRMDRKADPEIQWVLMSFRHLCPECGEEHELVRPREDEEWRT